MKRGPCRWFNKPIPHTDAVLLQFDLMRLNLVGWGCVQYPLTPIDSIYTCRLQLEIRCGSLMSLPARCNPRNGSHTFALWRNPRVMAMENARIRTCAWTSTIATLRKYTSASLCVVRTSTAYGAWEDSPCWILCKWVMWFKNRHNAIWPVVAIHCVAIKLHWCAAGF